MEQNKVGELKGVGRIVTGLCVGMVVDNVVKSVLPDNAGKVVRLASAVGGWVISGVITKVAEDNVMESYERMKESVNGILNGVKETKEDDLVVFTEEEEA